MTSSENYHDVRFFLHISNFSLSSRRCLAQKAYVYYFRESWNTKYVQYILEKVPTSIAIILIKKLSKNNFRLFLELMTYYFLFVFKFNISSPQPGATGGTCSPVCESRGALLPALQTTLKKIKINCKNCSNFSKNEFTKKYLKYSTHN